MSHANISLETMTETLIGVVGEFNEGLKPKEQIKWSPNVELIGSSGQLDSLGLLDFLARVEEQLKTKFDLEMTLVTEELMARTRGGMTLETLASYLVTLIEKVKSN